MLFEAGISIDDRFTRQHDPFLKQNRSTAALLVELRANWDTPGDGGFDIAIEIHHAELKCRGRPQQFFGLGGILDPWQLHHDAGIALLLDDRLGYAELVYSIAQRGQVLLDRGLARGGQKFWFGLQKHREFFGSARVGHVQIDEIASEELSAAGFGFSVQKSDKHTPCRAARHRAEADLVFAKGGTEFRNKAIFKLPLDGIDIDLHQKMHAAAKVKPHVHRLATQAPQPLRRRRCEV